MSVIAWDGECLAADKRATVGSLYVATTKIWRREDGSLCGYAGDADAGEELKAWWWAGAVPADFPPSRRDDSKMWASLLVVTPEGRLEHYQRTPHPVRYDEGQKFAIGSGRDFALAAMHLGKSAAEAVRVTCEFDQCCGNGVDELRLNTDDAELPSFLRQRPLPEYRSDTVIFRRITPFAPPSTSLAVEGVVPEPEPLPVVEFVRTDGCNHSDTMSIWPTPSERDPLGQATLKCRLCGALGLSGLSASEWF